MKVKLVLAYDGHPFDGWQSQASGNAVQDHLESAVKRIVKHRLPVQGSGRTDAGVHALAQIAHFELPESSRMTPVDWTRALNCYLPLTIRVLKASFVPDTFHARFSARGKHYRYRICPQAVLPPWDVGRAWHVPQPLDLDLLNAVAEKYLGRQDFRSFAANRGRVEKETIRTITRAKWRTGRDLTFEVEGDGFLYKMVRLLVGSAVHVALGKAELSWIDDLIANPAAGRNSQVAPADGLYLVKVKYSARGSGPRLESREDRG